MTIDEAYRLVRKERRRAHYLAHKEQHRESNRLWRARNKDKIRAYNKAYRERQ